MASNWISYNELAWTEDFLADPSDYKQEAAYFADLLKRTAKLPVHSLLHLGCGAGGHDRFFKQYFTVTGVDLSLGMLSKARETNPEIEYVEGDMRTIRLDRQFDAAAIPDSIDYMSSLEDLKKTIHTAAVHLKPGGALLIVSNTAEKFQDNNFAYSGEKSGIHVTVFENNYRNPYVPNTYEITLFYLIRKHGKLTTYSEHTIAGLFPQASWEKVFEDTGMIMHTQNLEGTYNKYLLGDGEYHQTIFVGWKRG